MDIQRATTTAHALVCTPLSSWNRLELSSGNAGACIWDPPQKSRNTRRRTLRIGNAAAANRADEGEPCWSSRGGPTGRQGAPCAACSRRPLYSPKKLPEVNPSPNDGQTTKSPLQNKGFLTLLAGTFNVPPFSAPSTSPRVIAVDSREPTRRPNPAT